MSDRRSVLVAALGFVLLGNWQSVPELVILHAWLDTWSGLGAVVVVMERHGFEVWLAGDLNAMPSHAAFMLGVRSYVPPFDMTRTGKVYCGRTVVSRNNRAARMSRETLERPLRYAIVRYIDNVTSGSRLRWPHHHQQTARRSWLVGMESLA